MHTVHGGEWFTVVLHGMQAFDQHNMSKYHYITVLQYQWTVFIHSGSSKSFHFIVLFWTTLTQTIHCARFGVPSVLLTALHNEKNRQSLDWFVWKPRLTDCRTDCPSSKPLTLMELLRLKHDRFALTSLHHHQELWEWQTHVLPITSNQIDWYFVLKFTWNSHVLKFAMLPMLPSALGDTELNPAASFWPDKRSIADSCSYGDESSAAVSWIGWTYQWMRMQGFFFYQAAGQRMLKGSLLRPSSGVIK